MACSEPSASKKVDQKLRHLQTGDYVPIRVVLQGLPVGWGKLSAGGNVLLDVLSPSPYQETTVRCLGVKQPMCRVLGPKWCLQQAKGDLVLVSSVLNNVWHDSLCSSVYNIASTSKWTALPSLSWAWFT